MALDTDFTDFANAIKTVVLTQKADFEIEEEDFYLFEVPQKFRLPAIFLLFRTAKITRMQPAQGQWEIDFSLIIAEPEVQRNIRQTNLFDKLATLIKLLMKNPSLGGKSIYVEASDADVDILAEIGADQGTNAAAFLLKVWQEPVAIQAVEI